MDIQIIDPTRYPGWDDLVLSHPEGSFFHSAAWARVLSESYDFTPLYFTVLKEGKLSALLPVMEVKSILTGVRGVSLPFTDYCDPIVTGEDDESASLGKEGQRKSVGFSFVDLSDRVIGLGRKRNWKYVEVRCSSRQLQVLSLKGLNSVNCESVRSESVSASHSSTPAALRLTPDDSLTPHSSLLAPYISQPFVSFVGHILDLCENEEDVMVRFRDSAKRNIKKAVREGVEAEIFSSSESVREFYRLNSLTRRDHGLPPQPYRFFESLQRHVISKGYGFVVLASCRGEFIAGAVFLHFGKKAIYKYGASDRRYQHLRPNNLVMWEAIRWHCQRGYTSLCLGRTEPENQGLLQFKSGLRPTEHPIHYYRYDLKKGAFVSGSSNFTGFHNRIFGSMPICLLNRVGGLLYRHVG